MSVKERQKATKEKRKKKQQNIAGKINLSINHNLGKSLEMSSQRPTAAAAFTSCLQSGLPFSSLLFPFHFAGIIHVYMYRICVIPQSETKHWHSERLQLLCVCVWYV